MAFRAATFVLLLNFVSVCCVAPGQISKIQKEKRNQQTNNNNEEGVERAGRRERERERETGEKSRQHCALIKKPRTKSRCSTG